MPPQFPTVLFTGGVHILGFDGAARSIQTIASTNMRKSDYDIGMCHLGSFLNSGH